VLDLTVDCLPHHRVDDRAAEAAPFRRRHERPFALSPADREDTAVNPPTYVNVTGVCRQRAVFTGIGRKLVECEPDGLRGDCIQTHLRAVRSDPRPQKVRKMRELGAHQILDINALPLVPDQQVLIGRERLNALSEALDKILRLTSRGLAGDCLHDTEHVLGAMTDLTH
jgi:hypothetical protein